MSILSIKYQLTFQAGLVAIQVDFKQEPEDDKPEPLEMEHFYFPLGLWLAGLIVSTVFLLAEIIVNRRKQPARDIPMAPPEFEVENQSNVEDIKDI